MIRVLYVSSTDQPACRELLRLDDRLRELQDVIVQPLPARLDRLVRCSRLDRVFWEIRRRVLERWLGLYRVGTVDEDLIRPDYSAPNEHRVTVDGHVDVPEDWRAVYRACGVREDVA